MLEESFELPAHVETAVSACDSWIYEEFLQERLEEEGCGSHGFGEEPLPFEEEHQIAWTGERTSAYLPMMAQPPGYMHDAWNPQEMQPLSYQDVVAIP